MIDIRRILIIFVVAVLFAVLVFSTIAAVYPSPEYNDYCDHRTSPKPRAVGVECSEVIDPVQEQACWDSDGEVQYKYDANGCPVSMECSTCRVDYDAAKEQHDFWSFIMASVFGIMGILISLFLPMKKGSVHEWVGSGLMLGGIIALFGGTLAFWSGLHRWVRPLVILLELVIIVYLAYKRLSPDKD